MKNVVVIIVASLMYITSVVAQCDTGSEPECMCGSADVLCSLNDLDGFSFRMGALNHPGDAPNPLCPGVNNAIPQNPNWFAFTSFCTDISIEVSIDNCNSTGFSGAQIAVYADCNYTPVDCDVSTADCTWPTSRTINLTNLTLGNTYYFLVDGCGGDVCDISVDVLGSCGANEIDDWTFGIDGPETICQLGPQDYILERPDGTDRLFYTINGGAPIEGFGNPVSIDFPAYGTYTICIDVDNEPCVPITDNPAPYCTTIEVVNSTGDFEMSPTSGCPGSTIAIVNVLAAVFDPALEYQYVVVDEDNFVVEVILSDNGEIILTDCGTYDVHLITSFGETATLVFDIDDFFQYFGCPSGCCHITTQQLRIEDFDAPIFVGAPADVTFDCDADLEVLITPPDVFDDCGVARDTFSRRVVSQSCDSSVYTYFWSAIDFCDNTATDSSRVVLSHPASVEWLESPADSLLSCITLLPPPYYIDYDIQSASSCGTDSVLATLEWLSPSQVSYVWAVSDSCVTDTLRQLWTVADSVSLRFTTDSVRLCDIDRLAITDILAQYLDDPDTIPYLLTITPPVAGDTVDISAGVQLRIEASGSVSCPLVDSIYLVQATAAMVNTTVAQPRCGGDDGILTIAAITPAGSTITNSEGMQVIGADTLAPGTYTYYTASPVGCIDSFVVAITTPQDIALQLSGLDCSYASNAPDSVLISGAIEDLFANITTINLNLNGTAVPLAGGNTFAWTVIYADPLVLDFAVVTDQGCMLDTIITIPEVCASCDYSWTLPDTISRACFPQEACVTALYSAPPEEVIWTYAGAAVASGAELCAIVDGWYVMAVRFDSICAFADSVYLDTELGVETITYVSDSLLDCTTTSIDIDYTTSLTDGLVQIRYNGSALPGTTITAPGTYTLILVDEASGCRLDSTVVEVQIDTMRPDFDLLVSPDSTVDCTTEFVSLVLDYEDTDMMTQWLIDGLLVSDVDSIVLDSAAFVQVTITDMNNGCTSTAAVSISDLVNVPVINEFPASTLTCIVDTILLDASASIASAASRYEWYDAQDNLLADDAQILVVTTPGAYRLRIIDPVTGCDEEQVVDVTQDISPPTVRLSTDLIDLTCDTPSMIVPLIGLEPNVEISWLLNGSLASTGPAFGVSDSGTYTMSAINTDNGCTYDESFVVTTAGIEGVTLLLEPAACIGDEGLVSLSAITGGQPTYDIQLDGQPLSIDDEVAIDPGTYTLSILDAAGCAYDTLLAIPTLSGLALETTYDTIVYSDVREVRLQLPSDVVAESVQVQWSGGASLSCNDCRSPTLEEVYTGDLEAIITDTYGCSKLASYYLLFQSDAFSFPNIFSPSSSVGNDRFTLKAADLNAIIVRLNIYDRWGNLMYTEQGKSTSDPSHGWDGRYGGQAVGPGVYVYFAELQVNGDMVTVGGDVTLLE